MPKISFGGVSESDLCVQNICRILDIVASKTLFFCVLWMKNGDGKMAAMLRCMMRQRSCLDGAMLPDLF